MRKEFSYFEKDNQYFPIIEVKLKNHKNELSVRHCLFPCPSADKYIVGKI